MVGKSDAYELDLLKLTFNGTAITNIAANGASPLTVLQVELHTASPGDAGNQTTSEIAYTGYARVAVNRDNTGWDCTANPIKNAAAITFGQRTDNGSAVVATDFSIGTTSGSATGKILYFGSLSTSLSITQNITPSFASNALTVSED